MDVSVALPDTGDVFPSNDIVCTVQLSFSNTKDGFVSKPPLPQDVSVYSWRVDLRPPVASFESAPPAAVATREVNVAFACDEPGCAYQYSVDDAGWVAADVSAGDDDEGGGNGLFSGATRIIEAPPRVTPDVDVSFELATDLRVAHWEFDLDDEGWVVTGAHVQLLRLSEGRHNVRFRAIERGTELADALPVGHTFRVDSAAPPGPVTVQLLTKPQQLSPLAVATFQLMAPGYEHDAWFEYRIDGGDWRPTLPELVVGPVTAGSHFIEFRGASEASLGVWGPAVQHTWVYEPRGAAVTVSVAADAVDGEHSMRVRATDPVGHLGEASEPASWVLDTTPPTTAVELLHAVSDPWPAELGVPPPDAATPAVVTGDALRAAVWVVDGGANCTNCLGGVCSASLVLAGAAVGDDGEDGDGEAGATTLDLPCAVASVVGGEAGHDDAYALSVDVGAGERRDGLVQVAVQAVDAVGNVALEAVAFDVLRDGSAPNVTLEALGAAAYDVASGEGGPTRVFYVAASGISVRATCADAAGRGCAFSVHAVNDSSIEWTERSRSAALPEESVFDAVGVDDGAYTLVARAADAAGQFDPLGAVLDVVVDSVAPSVALLSIVTDDGTAVASGVPTTASDFSVAVRADEPVAGFLVCMAATLVDADAAEATGPVVAPAPTGSCVENVNTTAFTSHWVSVAFGDNAAELVVAGLTSGQWDVWVWARDLAGNTDNALATVVSVVVDQRPPLLTAAPQLPIMADAVARVDVEATEPVALVRYAVDDGAWADADIDPASASVTVAMPAVSSDGHHSARVRATDVAGNPTAAATTVEWWLDTAAPIISADSAAAVATTLRGSVVAGAGGAAVDVSRATNASTVELLLHCDDGDGALAPGAVCVVDAEATPAGDVAVVDTSADPVTRVVLSPGGEGPRTLALTARDGVDNETPLHVSWIVDRTFPGVSFAVGTELPRFTPFPRLNTRVVCHDATACAVRYQTVGESLSVCNASAGAQGDETTTFVASEWHVAPVVAVDAPRDGAAVVASTHDIDVAALADGDHVLYVEASDGASLATALPGVLVTVDTVPPAPPTVISGPAAFTKEAAFTWEVSVDGDVVSGSPAAVTLQYQLIEPGGDATPWQDVAGSEAAPGSGAGGDAGEALVARFGVTTASDGAYLMLLRAVDAAGNTGDTTRWQWSVARKQPDTLLVREPPAVFGRDHITLEFRYVAAEGAGAALDATEGAGAALDAAGIAVMVSVDGGEWSPTSEPCDAEGYCRHRMDDLTLSHTYVVNARAIDAANNTDDSPAQAAWTVQVCGANQFSYLAADGALSCSSCPEGALCGEVVDANVSDAEVGARPGYWTSGTADSDPGDLTYYAWCVALRCLALCYAALHNVGPCCALMRCACSAPPALTTAAS